MPFSPKINSLIEPKNQKKRGRNPCTWPKYNFGVGTIILINEGKLEYPHLEFLRKLIKNFPHELAQFSDPYKHLLQLKKRVLRTPKIINWNEIDLNLKKCFLVKLNLNCPVTKKSKNSRMGKGKGSLLRWSVRCSRFSKIVEFRYLSFFKIKLLFFKLQKKIPLKMILLFKKDLIVKTPTSFHKDYYWYQYVSTYKNHLD